ncbi:MAG: TIGR03790 family protein [Desulfobulbus propionicus]|nr:MAG: TIGR03790 family protein [Desulfobulbus propionicus]
MRLNSSSCHYCLAFLLSLLTWLLPAPPLQALEPEEVAVIANSRVPESLRLARLYMKLRHIPANRLITVDTRPDEICSREQYQLDIAGPVRQAVERLRNQHRIRCLVSIYGLPLKISPTANETTDAQTLARLHAEITQLQEEQSTAATELREIYDSRIRQKGWELDMLERTDSRAAVDSELALVLAAPYALDTWQPNPFYLGFHYKSMAISTDQVLMVSRLDGPDAATVERLITDTLQAEQQGLRGKACLDARWPAPAPETQLSAYAFYDQSLHRAADQLKAAGWPVALDQEEALITDASRCRNTALYAGWYSLNHYVDAFTWVPGAIGYHIASGECSTLKRPASTGWCKRMLEDGVAATIGPVYEPYIQAFPLPELFMTRLIQGYLSLGEAYLVSLPYLSWQMVLIGDPLYRPFPPAEN